MKLCDFVDTVHSTDWMKRKKKARNDPQLDKVVFIWFVISGPIFSSQAQKLHNDLDVGIPSDFVASRPWYIAFNIAM